MLRIMCATLLTAGFAAPVTAQMGRFSSGNDWFAEADADSDGQVTRTEFQAMRDRNFSKLDRNGDGIVSPSDFPRLAKIRPDAYRRVTAMVEQADANGDGAVSHQEMVNSRAMMFDMADRDRNGIVTKAEANAAKQAMHDMAAQRRDR